MSKRPLLAIALLAAGCDAPTGNRTIRFPQAVNALHPRVVTSQEFGERLERNTDGRLRVEIYPGGQLYGARQAVQAAALGDVEMAMEPETHFITFDDVFRAVDLPFVFQDEAYFRRFLEGTFRDRIERSLEERGLVLLALWDEGPMVLGSRDTVLRTPDAFPGAKIRSSGHDLLARSWNALGATTVRLPIEEVYTALQQGVADAIYTTLYTFVAGKFYEVAPKAVVWPSRATYVWVVNAAFWRALSPEDRDLVRQLVDEASETYHQRLDASRSDMEGTIRSARDGELVVLTADELDVLRQRSDALLTGWRTEYADVLPD